MRLIKKSIILLTLILLTTILYSCNSKDEIKVIRGNVIEISKNYLIFTSEDTNDKFWVSNNSLKITDKDDNNLSWDKITSS